MWEPNEFLFRPSSGGSAASCRFQGGTTSRSGSLALTYCSYQATTLPPATVSCYAACCSIWLPYFWFFVRKAGLCFWHVWIKFVDTSNHYHNACYHKQPLSIVFFSFLKLKGVRHNLHKFCWNMSLFFLLPVAILILAFLFYICSFVFRLPTMGSTLCIQ
jgi:hypothetical protein